MHHYVTTWSWQYGVYVTSTQMSHTFVLLSTLTLLFNSKENVTVKMIVFYRFIPHQFGLHECLLNAAFNAPRFWAESSSKLSIQGEGDPQFTSIKRNFPTRLQSHWCAVFVSLLNLWTALITFVFLWPAGIQLCWNFTCPAQRQLARGTWKSGGLNRWPSI